MKLGQPRCAGAPGRPHPEIIRRLESQGEGSFWMWRCPECWSTERYAIPELLDRLHDLDAHVVLVSRAIADGLRVASEPIRIQLDPTDDERILEMTCMTVGEHDPPGLAE